MRTFRVVWAGQLVSALGSGLTAFAMPIWVFLETRSVTTFALIALVATLPTLLLAPAAGAYVDRWDRRSTMMLADLAAGLVTATIAVVYLTSGLQIWHLFVASALMGAASAFQVPAYLAAVPLLVPKEHLSKANGQVQLSQAMGNLVSPALAGVLLATVGLGGIMLVDVVTFLLAIGSLLFVRFPPVPRDASAGEPESFWAEAMAGWHYLRSKSGMLALLFIFAGVNFALTLAMVLFSPMMLAFTTEQVVGFTLSVAGIGMVAGSLLMSTWKGAESKIAGVLWPIMLGGLALIVAGLRPNALLVTVGLFLLLLLVPIASASSAVLWQTKIPAELHGRAFSVRRVLAQSATPVSYVLAGPLIDNWFDPWLAEDGVLADTVGRLVGVGPGRGIGFLFVIAGLVVALIGVFGYLYAPVRNLEHNHPDVALPPNEDVPVAADAVEVPAVHASHGVPEDAPPTR